MIGLIIDDLFSSDKPALEETHIIGASHYFTNISEDSQEMPQSRSTSIKGRGEMRNIKKSKRKVQGVPQSQIAALPRHQEEEETDKTKQAQIEQTYEKH